MEGERVLNQEFQVVLHLQGRRGVAFFRPGEAEEKGLPQMAVISAVILEQQEKILLASETEGEAHNKILKEE